MFSNGPTGVILGNSGAFPKWQPVCGNRFVYLCSDQSHLCIQDRSSSSPKPIYAIVQIELAGESVPATEMWSEDGQWIYFSSAKNGDWVIYRIHPDGMDQQNLTVDWMEFK